MTQQHAHPNILHDLGICGFLILISQFMIKPGIRYLEKIVHDLAHITLPFPTLAHAAQGQSIQESLAPFPERPAAERQQRGGIGQQQNQAQVAIIKMQQRF